MSEGLRLHYAPDNASLCVRLALEKLGLAYQTVLVDRAARAQKSPAYLALNPNGLIPTLETPQGAMYETGAILLWLADQRPGVVFPGADDPSRGGALTWLFWLSNTLHPCLRRIFYPDLYGPGEEVRATAKAEVVRHLTNLDAHWAAIENPLLSCYAAPCLRWVVVYGGKPGWVALSQWPALDAFAKEFETLPFVVRAALAEGLGPTPFSQPRLPNPPEGSAT
jgi:glutathione S-transferase